jgi:hypothetical protein
MFERTLSAPASDSLSLQKCLSVKVWFRISGQNTDFNFIGTHPADIAYDRYAAIVLQARPVCQALFFVPLMNIAVVPEYHFHANCSE